VSNSKLFFKLNEITQMFREIKCACKHYADDLKLYTVLHADEDDRGNSQDKLKAIIIWLVA